MITKEHRDKMREERLCAWHDLYAKLIENTGWTVQRVADHLMVSKSAVQRWNNSSRIPQRMVIEDLKRILETKRK